MNDFNHRRITEELLGDVCWTDEHCGFCPCPGEEFHTSRTGPKDCRVKIDGIPTAYCVHQSCQEEVEGVNFKLRRAILGANNAVPSLEIPPVKFPKPGSPKGGVKQFEKSLAAAAEKSLPLILERFAVDPEQLSEKSPYPVPSDPNRHWKLLLRLFGAGDVVWIGNIYDSGPRHEQNFRRISDWLLEEEAPAQFTCPSTFQAGVCSRCNANVVKRPYLVVESDHLNKAEITSIFLWLRQSLNLRAVVDTAGRSLHGWFDYPETEKSLNDLKVILKGFRCDPALFKPAQPVRLPGAIRNGKYQTLRWIDIKEFSNYGPN